MSDHKATPKTLPSENIQAHIFYSGMVQGVGFRYTTHRVALSLGLKGWVKNCSDGRVEILVQGKKENIETMMDDLASHFGSYIRDKNLAFQRALGQYNDFQVIV